MVSSSAAMEHRYTYGVGEEVVVALDRVLDVRRRDGTQVAAGGLPSWIIGEVVALRAGDDGVAYEIRFEYEREVYACAVGEGSIEGTA